MNFLVGDLVLSGGEKVTVIWSDGRRTDADVLRIFSILQFVMQ